jgi:DASS family divalent anion:Na+ symporter
MAKKIDIKILSLMMVFLIGFLVWHIPCPEGMDVKVWHLFAIFVATISAIILNPIPMGASALIAILFCALTKTLSLEECLAGFGTETVWLVVFAFFISLGFIKTGLGSRCAYYFISKVGHTTLGLSYSLVLADFLLSPLIPSVTARGGGIIFPIAQSLCKSFEDENRATIGAKTSGYIMQVCFQANVITSAMFVTAMAANPLVVKFASNFGVEISWMLWAKAAFLPGVLCLLMMPLLLFMLHTPSIKRSETAPAMARQKLADMGSMKVQEIVMLCTFFLLLILWIFGGKYGISAALTALLGLSILFITRAISLDDAIADRGAWHTFLWFSTLVMMSGFLSKSGLMSLFGQYVKGVLPQDNMTAATMILLLVYFYIHYMFASTTAHITVLYPTFLFVLISYGVPPMVSALGLGMLSTLSGGITHFSIASAPIFFGSNYISTKTWWFLGLMCSFLYIIVMATFGLMWWKVLGLW